MKRRIRWGRLFSGRPVLTSQLLSLLLLTTLSAPLTAAPLFEGIVVFGDSLSDIGNTEVVVPGGDIPGTDFTYGTNGRFTNDRVWVEYLADRLGVSEPLVASRQGGSNYAHGGAMLNLDDGPSAGLLLQYQQWQASLGSGGADADVLYVVWGGANDLRAGMMMPGLDLGAFVNDRLTAYAALLADLIASGAESILVPNLPNLGYAPEAQMAGVADQVTALVTFWNAGLESVLDTIQATSDVTLYRADIFGAVEQIFANPAAFGLSNVTDPCSTVVNNVEIPCATPEQYAFWDTLHPTSTAHQLFAEIAYASITESAPAVPTPATLWLLLAGMGLLVWQQSQAVSTRAARAAATPSA
jgi:phospholipase/lecithinase/hemolysin